MQCYTEDEVPVLSQLAKNYAICDRWFGSIPCETWPNRSFFHAGTSFGRLNNCNPEYQEDCVPNFFVYAGKRTIFDVFEEQGVSWNIFTSSILDPYGTLTAAQFFPIWSLKRSHNAKFPRFEYLAKNGELPAYSFLEPEFWVNANDQHPPHDVQKGEKFLQRIWDAVSNGPNWYKTLLVITYDEHGGCYDHVPPPDTATPPDDYRPQFPFDFKRFGPRVPTVLVSPLIEKGTVFRSAPPNDEFDHTSMLSSLREWIWVNQQRPTEREFLPSKRISNAPTIWDVLTLETPRSDKPVVKALASDSTEAEIPEQLEPPTSLHKALILDAEITRIAREREERGETIDDQMIYEIHSDISEQFDKLVDLYQDGVTLKN